ncbi:unnamed protein product [Lupinus luteus]|uniref:Diacylglycerol O-acyltransferase n=1 Tax=Lupinus luteus TaxID=3873 RepID=A0AAV1YG33_LUPLU
MNDLHEEVSFPVSPIGEYFNSSVLSVSVLGVMETEVAIDVSQIMSLIKSTFLPINMRYSSTMIVDKEGHKHWKQVEVNIKEHVKIPIFPTISDNLYDDYFDEYLSRIALEQFPEDKPLWQIHIINYPTSNSAAALIFKLHHSLGDGYSILGALYSCLQRVDNPSLPLIFPSSKKVESKTDNKTILSRLPQNVSLVMNGVLDFGWSLLKSTKMVDKETPIRSGNDDVRFQPVTILNVSFSLDSIKEVKDKLRVSVNDVLIGVIFFAIRLYMRSMNHESVKTKTTALVLLNTRNTRAYKSVQEMIDTNSDAPWGNRFSFLHIPIPELSDANYSKPLDFVLEASKIIKRKRYSLAIPMNGVLLDLVNKFKGPQAAARYLYDTLKNTSVTISYMVGPSNQVALASNLPVKGLYFYTLGSPQSITVTAMSYMGRLRVGFGVEKGFIDAHQFKSCIENSMEQMIKEAKRNF